MTFKAEEPFGVSHPDQILSFQPPTGTSIDHSSSVVTKSRSGITLSSSFDRRNVGPAQRWRGQNSQFEWKVQSGVPTDYSSASTSVKVRDTGASYEIDNGIIAFRVTKPISGLNPAFIDQDRLGNGPFVPAPYSRMRHVDGTWTAHRTLIRILLNCL